MAQSIDFDERIDVAAQLTKRAKIFYDVWWLYEGTDTRPIYLASMNRFSEFFRFDSHAHFVSLVIHLAGLFESRSDTINFPVLVAEAENLSLVNAAAIAQARTVLDQIASLPSKLTILRSNLFAHRSARLFYKEAFEKADITPDQVRDLAVAALRIANLLLSWRGLPEQHFHELSRHDAESLLKRLSGAPAG